MFIPIQLKNPATVDKLTNQLHDKGNESARVPHNPHRSNDARTKWMARNSLENFNSPTTRIHKRQPRKTTRRRNRNNRQPTLGTPSKHLGRLTSQRQPIQHSRRGIQERVAGGERGGEDAGVDDVWEDFDTCAGHGDDVGGLGGCDGVFEEGGVVVGD